MRSRLRCGLRAVVAVATASHGPQCARLEEEPSSVQTLPRWMIPLAAHGAEVPELSRKEKIGSFEEAQSTPEAKRANASIPPAPPSMHPTRLRLVSFNVHFMRDCQMKDNHGRVVDAVRAMDADIVAFQEAPLPEGLTSSSPGKSGDDFAELMASLGPVGVNAELGKRLVEDMKSLGYHHVVFSPSFQIKKEMDIFGNAVFSRRSLMDGHWATANAAVTLDLNRSGVYEGRHVSCSRSAAVALLGFGDMCVTIASLHLDVLAEMGAYFAIAEGELVRLLEFEALHHAVRDMPNVVMLGDFNATSRLSSSSGTTNCNLARALDQESLRRSPWSYRHTLPRNSQRLPDDWCLTALGLAEGRLGYRHAWQLAGQSAPLYSHWSGQLIDHCLLRDLLHPGQETARIKPTFVGLFHTDASDHLPLIVDLEVDCT